MRYSKFRLGLWALLLFILPSTYVWAGAQQRNDKMLVSTDWLAKNAGRVVILHIAPRREHYDAGHIPNAIFVAWGEITATRNGIPNELAPAEQLQKLFTQVGLGNTKRIVIYGDLNGLAAARAFFTLDYLGHGERVALLDGGLEKWKAEKRALANDSVMRSPDEFTPKINPRAVIALDGVRDVSWSVTRQSPAPFALVDARPAEEYSGAKSGEGVARPGHIPGAVNVFWQSHLVSRENPVLKPEKELRKLYEAAGVQAGKTAVVYCRTGGQASHTYFTLRYLGYNVMMYDGSFFEWNKQLDTPVIIGK